MEQSVRSDSIPVSAGHETTDRFPDDTGRNAAITKMLTNGAVRDTAGRFSKRKAAEQPTPSLREPVREEAAPRGTVPAPVDAPDGTYGLTVRDGSLGLHAAPGASVLVAPEMPTGAGLAVFYLKGAASPVIYDLTHNFRAEYARPFAPGSEVVPLIEVVQPGTGRHGRLRADRVAMIHRVIGVYTPAEIAAKHRIAPAPLPLMSTCPDGMGEQYVDDTGAYPLVRRGETVVYDPSRREPTHGALCVMQWNNGTRGVMLTNHRQVGGKGEKYWWTDPVNRPANREALEQQVSSGSVGVLHMSDGPYDADHLHGKIVGTVVGVLVPQRAGEPMREVSPEPAPEPTQPLTAGDIYAASDPSALAQRFDAAHATWREAAEADREPNARYRSAIEAAKVRGGLTVEDLDAAAALPGVKHSAAAEEAAFGEVGDLGLKILRLPARSIADLALQARAVIPHVWPMGTYEADAALAPDEDIDKEAVRSLIEACCSLAGVDWRGQPRAAPAVSQAIPELVTDDYVRAFHHAIGEHRLAVHDFASAINPADDEWVEQNGGDASAAAMALAVAAREASGEREFQAWRDVFKVRPRTWHHLSILLEHVAEHFDDHQGMANEPDVFGALIGAVNGLRFASSELTATHDMSLLSFNHLEYLSDICRQQARVLQAFEQNHSETPFGVILDREATRLAILGDQASDEIGRRQPTSDSDRNFRLESMIKSDLSGNGYIEPALLAEAVAAWGTR